MHLSFLNLLLIVNVLMMLNIFVDENVFLIPVREKKKKIENKNKILFTRICRRVNDVRGFFLFGGVRF